MRRGESKMRRLLLLGVSGFLAATLAVVSAGDSDDANNNLIGLIIIFSLVDWLQGFLNSNRPARYGPIGGMAVTIISRRSMWPSLMVNRACATQPWARPAPAWP